MRLNNCLFTAALAAITIAPPAATAQIVVRDPCFYIREDCARRDEAQQRARERAFDAQSRARDRVMEAQERARERASEALERSLRAVDERRTHDFAMRMMSEGRQARLRAARAPRETAGGRDGYITLPPGVRRRWP